MLLDEKKPVPLATGNNLYCAGYIQTAPVNTDYEVVGAQDESNRFIYAQGNFLYINKGANRDVKVGDMFSVIRPRGRVESRWTDKKNIGYYVQEVGMVEVVDVKSYYSVARVRTSCDNLLFGDLLEPIPERVSPLFTPRPPLDVFASSSCKVQGRILMARDEQEMVSRNQIVYVDLGADDNVKVGNYLTIYRPLGTGDLLDHKQREIVPARDEGFQSDEYRGGKFSNQAARKKGKYANGDVVTSEDVKNRRPVRPTYLREIVGEMVILNVKEKTATALITRVASEIHTGDRVELQLGQ